MTPRDETFIAHLRRAVLSKEWDALNDAQLLTRYIEARDEAAIEMLVWRHGPMVWGVCRRKLANQQDAEDAFQATFLVLVRKAVSVSPRDMVGNWLYGVARQTAHKARAAADKRRLRERQVATLPEPPVSETERPCEDFSIVDRELSRLPKIYRSAIVLCDLEGMTEAEAAQRLAVPQGTLSARLSRGRQMLAKRLARQGLTGAALAAAGGPATGGTPAVVIASTIKAASLFAAGKSTLTVSTNVITLANGILTSMLMTKLKITFVAVLAVGLLAVGGGWFMRESVVAQDNEPAAQEAKPLKQPWWVVRLTIIDLMPQKGPGGAIAAPKGPIDEKDFSGPQETIDLFGRRVSPDKRTTLPSSIRKLFSDGLAYEIRNLEYAGVVNQKFKVESVGWKSLAYVEKTGKISLGRRRVGTVADANIQFADEKTITVDLEFEDTRAYPPEIGGPIVVLGSQIYGYGLRPNLDVGPPPVKDNADRECQPYEIITHTLKTKLTIPYMHTVLAKGVEATSSRFGDFAEDREIPCPPQIMLLVTNLFTK